MSEMMGVEIQFVVPLTWRGPDVAQRGWAGNTYWVPQIKAKIPFPDYDEPPWDVTPFEDRLLCSWSGEMNYGWDGDESGTALVNWLFEHRVPYIASTDAKYEFDGVRQAYDGGTEVHETTGTNAGAVLTGQDWAAMRAAAEKREAGEIGVLTSLVARVDEWFRQHNLDLTAVDIAHLPAEPPIDDEEEEDAD